MESFDRRRYQITLVAPLKQDYEIAKFFLQNVVCEFSLKTSGALCTLGKLGPHHFILAGNSRDTCNTALFVNDTVNDLLAEFSSIRVGFLIGVGAVAPAEGLARTGDIVIGTPQGLEPGLVQFDAEQTIHLNRLCVTHQMSRTPHIIYPIVNGLRSGPGRLEFRKELLKSATVICSSETDQTNLGWSDSVKVLHGKIASSQSNLPRNDVLNKAGRDSNVLCFERAAAKLKPQIPFLTICGITQTTNGFEDTLKQQRAGMAAIVYAMLITDKIDLQQLERQHIFTNLFLYDSFDLDLQLPSFRLIRLEKGTQLPLKCHLFQAYLNDESILPYAALSYVWGSQSTSSEIFLNKKVMFITTSLYDALFHLRQPDEDRIFWVDALCIDQSNVKERSHQVNQMSEIYRKAENVVIWLGYRVGDAVLLKTVVDQFAKQLPSEAFRKWPREDRRWQDQWRKVEQSLGIYDKDNLVNGLNIFLENPWFKRIWILQEVANAKRAIIECNLGNIPTKLFAMLPRMIDCPVSDQCQAVLDVMPGPSSTTSWWNRDRNLCTLLYKFKGCEASDPRDRVYGLLGIASDMASNAIEADYSKEEETIVQDLCVYFYEANQLDKKAAPRSVTELQSQLSTLSARVITKMLQQQITTQGLVRSLSRQGIMAEINGGLLHKIVNHGDVVAGMYLKKCEIYRSFSVNLDTAKIAFEKAPQTFDMLFQGQYIPPNVMSRIALWLANTGHPGLKNFLGRKGLVIDPDKELVMCLIEHEPEDSISLLPLLSKALRHPIRLSAAIFVSAIKRGMATVQFLLQHSRKPVRISRQVLIEAIRADNEVLRLVLEQFPIALYPNGKHPNVPFLMAASKSPETLQLLLDNCLDPIEAANMAVFNAVYRDVRKLEIVFGVFPFKIELSPSLFSGALRSSPTSLRLLFEHCARPINVTEEMSEQAVEAGIPFLKVVYDDWASHINSTELITVQAAIEGPETLEYLINNSKRKIQITERVIKESKASESSYLMLLELQKSERDVSEGEAIQAIQSGGEAFLELFNRPDSNFKLTKKIYNVALVHDYALGVLKRTRLSEVLLLRQ